MAQQEEGWPLGLQPLNGRVGLPRNGDFSGSISFNTLHTASPSASFTDDSSSSDLDTESTGSFFHDRSITLGSLIGASSSSSILKAASRVRKVEAGKEKEKKSQKTWMFSLCSRDTTDAHNNISVVVNPPSLGHFLAVERRAANESSRRNNVHSHSPNAIYGSDELALAAQSNTLFVNGEVAPPRVIISQWHDNKRRRNGELGHENGGPVLFSCMCGQVI